MMTWATARLAEKSSTDRIPNSFVDRRDVAFFNDIKNSVLKRSDELPVVSN